ncbi:MAG: DUF2059 domain-containing protein [Burkholderiaceae bacterium]
MKPMNRSVPVLRALTAATLALAMSGAAWAQASAAATPKTKAELVAKVLQLWHAEDIAVGMVQQPAIEAVGQARVALHNRVSNEKRDAALKDITLEAKKFVDEVSPTVRAAAAKAAPETAGKLLAERFTEDELRQLIVLMESPVRKKFDDINPELRRSLGEKVAAETRPTVDPKIAQMSQAIGERLRKAIAP